MPAHPWFQRTFKPIKCDHPATNLEHPAADPHQRRLVCLVCGRVVQSVEVRAA